MSPARSAAFDVLLRVERDQAYASELLHSPAHQQLSTADHGLATELVMGVLRWRSRLDDELAAVSSQPLAKLDCEILISLRLALYQFRWLNRVPRRAAVHESVELVKRARKHSASSFVNAVLRKLSSTHGNRGYATIGQNSTAEDIAQVFAHPSWMVERWAREYGVSVASQICEYDQTIPATTVRIRSAIAEADLVLVDKNLGLSRRRDDDGSPQQQAILAPGRLLASARRVEADDITKTQAFSKGAMVIQDEGSQLVAALLPDALTKQHRILDCCAAPGGKTLAIADRQSDASITAVEVYPQRARLLRKLLRVAGSDTRVRVIVADARNLPTSIPFDAVLADVPCSGTGTLGRNPDIKWRLTAADLVDLQARQIAIARSALEQLTPGGRLIYSTCSLETEENEDVIGRLLSNSFRLVDCRMELDRLKEAGELIWREPANLVRGPYLRTIPGIHPCDGFFAAILQRV